MDQVEKLITVIQKTLIYFVLMGLFLLFLTQGVLLIPGMNSRLNLAINMEGKPINKDETMLYQAGNISPLPWTSLTLKLLDYTSRPDVEVMIDGKAAGSFLRNEISLAVKQGEIITIFNPAEHLPIKVIISKKTANINAPDLNTMIMGTGRIFFQPIELK